MCRKGRGAGQRSRSPGRRQHEDSQGKLADLRAAVGVLTGRSDVDSSGSGLAGICLGGGYATERSASPHWRNEVTIGSLHSLMTFGALSAAELLAATPLLVIRTHIDLYDTEPPSAKRHE